VPVPCIPGSLRCICRVDLHVLWDSEPIIPPRQLFVLCWQTSLTRL
jgi:hypothetical protein